jgi:hypothetical protein
MAEWVRWSRSRAVYRGRISRSPFVEWTETVDGRAAIDALASRAGFSLLGKTWSTRRRLWRQLLAAASDAAVIAAIQHEIDGYFRLHGDLACAEGLPRVGVELRRLVVVPCALLNGGDGLRDVFVLRLIHEIEKAVSAALPSPKHPLAAGDGWITVGVNRVFVWRPPLLQGPTWTGHHYVLELRRQPITRAIRNAVAASISRLEASLESLSRVERQDILRRAEHRA